MIRASKFLLLLLALSPAAVGGESSLTVNRVIWVNATGTRTENCDNLRAVLDGLAGTTTASESYQVNLEPGTYECGVNTVNVPSYVAVVGTGVESTKITGTRSDTSIGVVDFFRVEHAELRHLKVQNVSFSGNQIAVSVYESQDVRISNVALISPGFHVGSAYGLSAQSYTTDDVDVLVRDSEIDGGTVAIFPPSLNSHGADVGMDAGLMGAEISVDLVGCEFNTYKTQAGGTPGTVRCSGSYQGDFDPLDKNCDP